VIELLATFSRLKSCVSSRQWGTLRLGPAEATGFLLFIRVFLALALCLVTFLDCVAIYAQGFVADQSNTSQLKLFQNVLAFAPIGQEFTPSMTEMNALEIQIESSVFEIPGRDLSYTGNLVASIRDGSVFGPLLGMSSLTPVGAQSSGLIRMQFPSAIQLTPGRTYVMLIGADFPANSGLGILVGSSGGPTSIYPGGNEILSGRSDHNNDLWFREGTVAIPEPSVFVLAVFASAVVFRPFKRKRVNA